MARYTALLAALALLVSGAAAQDAGQYGQCGGQGWTGATTCPSGWSCTVVSSIYYSQCLPGAATTTAATLTTTATGGTTGTATGTATSSAASGTTTLMTGYSFIRGVETPYFHQYLQSETLSKSSDGVLGSPGTASQFVVSGGQLQQYVTASSVLYGQVEARANSTVMKLKLSWAATPAATGTFVFSGDTLEWSTPDITRPQDNAWLICPDSAGHNDVYVNLGPYSYETPAGCADQTIHAYTGSTAVP